MSTQTSHQPAPHQQDLWILKTIFGASLFFLACFWALMVFFGPATQAQPRDLCYTHQATVRQAFESYCQKHGLSFAEMLARGEKGARLAPLIEDLRREGLLPSPPPSTSECRSWKDYLVLDLLHPEFEGISCRMHGLPASPKGTP